MDTEFNAGIGDLRVADFKLNAKGEVINTGNRPNPVAVVAREVFSGREYRMFQGEFPEKPPYDAGPRTLFLTFVASAEYGTHIALGWPLMENVIDLSAEWRSQRNGFLTAGVHYDLLSVAKECGLSTITKDHKKDMRNRILRGGPWLPGEREAILEYCASDIEPLWMIFLALLSGMLNAVPWRSDLDNLSYALIRGHIGDRGRAREACAWLNHKLHGSFPRNISLERVARHGPIALDFQLFQSLHSKPILCRHGNDTLEIRFRRPDGG